MKFNFTFRGMEPSQELKLRAQKKFEDRLSIFVGRRRPTEADITFERNAHLVVIKCTIWTADGFSARAQLAHADSYAALDLVLDKLGESLRRYKEKVQLRKMGFSQKARSQRVFLAWSASSPVGLANKAAATEVDAEEILAYERDHMQQDRRESA
jgi:ribosome-associated translation inhibitor RaiA